LADVQVRHVLPFDLQDLDWNALERFEVGGDLRRRASHHEDDDGQR